MKSSIDIPYSSVESAACFSFSVLIKKIKLKFLKEDPSISRSDLIEKILKNLKSFELNNQTFEYDYIQNYLGGVKWFVKCPKCGGKCYKLYLPQHDKKREQKYYCKKCHGLKNMSSLMGASQRYKKVYRPLRKLEKIKILLLKRNITPEKAKPLLDAYDIIEKELASSPEYRLWKFQKEHSRNNS